MQQVTPFTKFSVADARTVNVVIKKLRIDSTNPTAYNLAVGFIVPFLGAEVSVVEIERALRPLLPLYKKALESIELSL